MRIVGSPPVRGFVRDVPVAFPAPHHSAREGCPGHCDTLARTTVLVEYTLVLLTREQGERGLAVRSTWQRVSSEDRRTPAGFGNRVDFVLLVSGHSLAALRTSFFVVCL